MACYVENLFLKAGAIMVRYDVGPVKDGKVGEGMAEAQKVWTFRMATFNAQKISGRSA